MGNYDLDSFHTKNIGKHNKHSTKWSHCEKYELKLNQFTMKELNKLGKFLKSRTIDQNFKLCE